MFVLTLEAVVNFGVLVFLLGKRIVSVGLVSC